MTAVTEAILPWARRQRDQAMDYIEGIERGVVSVGDVAPSLAMTDEALKTIVLLRRVVADMEDLLAESDGPTNPSAGPA